MKTIALSAAWETDRGDISFQLSEDGQRAITQFPGQSPVDLSVADWRAFGQFLTRSMMIASPFGRSKINETDRGDIGGPQRAGAPWTDDEDERLEGAFKRAVDFDDIAKAHARSRGAILRRLEHLDMIPSFRERKSINAQSPNEQSSDAPRPA